jgi:PhoPQ-activated pathogenicity-related protein
MAKSVVRSMDALQAFAKQEWKTDVKNFVVSGASKRGWTSWLTAASGDKRVKAIAPLVIDTLNMTVQIENQKRSYGTGSEQIKDYTDNGLLNLTKSPDREKLLTMVDPYSYRERLTLPKMLIFGTNDRYWPQDALNSYWDGLSGEKHILYVPNAGHGLQETKNGKREQLPTRAVNTLAAFCRSQVYDRPLPKLTWKHGEKGDNAMIAVTSDRPMKSVRLYETTAATLDFRDSTWTPVFTSGKDLSASTLSTGYPTTGLKALLAEAEYEDDGQTYTLSTQLRILEPKK